MRPHPRYASSDPHAGAWATCDGCGFVFNHPDLRWNREWAGFSLVNKHTLVCYRCVDVPNDQLRSLVLPPDPDPVIYARPEQYAVDEGLIAVFTGSIAPNTSKPVPGEPFPAAIMTVTAIASGEVSTGAVLTGSGVSPGTFVGDQISGPNPPGGTGTYGLNISQTVGSTTLTASAGF